MSTAVQERLTQLWEAPHTFYGALSTVDHKTLGKRYLITAMVFLLAGGIEALIMRVQLARPGLALLTPEAYNQIFTMHATTMILWYASPILSGFAIFFIPLLIGARDLAFPRLNAFTYWTFLFSGLLLYGSVPIGQSPHAGWFAYVPYTLQQYSPGLGMDFFALAIILLTISTEASAINFIVTIFRLRAPGMAISKMPLVAYSTLTISCAIVLSLPSLTVACVFLELDRKWGFHFYGVMHGGAPLLWQQLFWIFGHPWVYVVFLPATGMVSMMIPVFSRRPIVGYPYIAISTVLTGLVGFGVWVHHMFAVGMSQMGMSFFSAASMTVSIFSAIQVFAWIATVWTGRPVPKAAFKFAMGFIALLVIGGLDGIATAVIPLDWQIHDTYFVVSHLHYVLVGTNLFPVFAAFYYWMPKITGRLLDERMGTWSFWIIFLGINVTFFPMHLLGIEGMTRRIYTYPASAGWGSMNMLVTVGAFALSFGILLSIINVFWSMRHGEIAGNNPWRGDTLEWSTDSPPAPYNSEHIPMVVSRNPLWDQWDEEKDPTGERILDQARLTFATSALDGVPEAVALMPADSILPLWEALAMTLFMVAILLNLLWVALAAAVATAALNAIWLWPKPVRRPS